MAHQGCKVFPLVKEVRAYVKEGDGDQGADCHDVADEHWINGTDPSTNNTPIANPMSGYAQYAGARKSWGINALGGLVVEVEADDGTTGVGVTIGGAAGAPPIGPRRCLRRDERCCERPGGGHAPIALTSRCTTASGMGATRVSCACAASSGS